MKPKVNDNEGRTIGVLEATKIKQCATKVARPCNNYSRTQGLDIRHGGSAIRRLRVTEGCDCGESARAVQGKGAVGCQPSEWIVAVTEQWDETMWGERRGRPNNRGN